jgi:SulP family sulfate permease
MVEVGRLSGTEHFRNRQRFEVETLSHLILLRVDESLIFANARYVETFVYDQLAGRTEVTNVVLICTATNFIDVTGLLMLEDLNENLREANIKLHFAEIKGPVLQQLENTSLIQSLTGEIFLTTDLAMNTLSE